MNILLHILSAVGFMAASTALAWGAYFSMRAFFAHGISEDTKALAGSVIFRVAALHGLILALVFAQQLLQYNHIYDGTVREATSLANIWYDIERYETPVEEEIRAAIGQYVREVIAREWDLLASEGSLLWDAWVQREIIYLAILDLEPETPRQTALRAHMLDDVQQIADLRQLRETSAAHNTSILFWIAAIGGILLVSMPYFVFAPSALHLGLLSVFAGYTGLVLFIIFAFSDPFATPGALQPVAFERLLANGIGG